MNLESWQAGIVLGSAVSLGLDWGVRALLLWKRRRGYIRCPHCDGLLGGDGRAKFPIERLKVCGVCGDTWPGSIVDRTQHAHRNGRGTTVPALVAIPASLTTPEDE